LYCPERLNKSEIELLNTPLALTAAEKLCIPNQLYPFFSESMSEDALKSLAKAYLSEASFDLRVNSHKSTRDAVLTQLKADDYEVEPTPFSPLGIRFSRRYSLEGYSLIKDGLVEVQDEGSQLIALSCEPTSKMTVLDYCAGAGGKTLALSAEMHNKGQLFACDIHEWRLKRAKERARRAGVHNVRFQKADDPKFLKRHLNFFDRVLVDAPCSGTGTWRRNPDMKFKTTADDIRELQLLQRTILAKTAPLVRQGGWLIYATCSVLKAENHDQIAFFLENNPGFTLATEVTNTNEPIAPFYKNLKNKIAVNSEIIANNDFGLQLLPHIHETDGFFISILIRTA
jgi:16S rRNA (cytosine967-C5)-methyltransferase